jgi:hypothetical protein
MPQTFPHTAMQTWVGVGAVVLLLLGAAPAVAQTFSRTNHTGLFEPLIADLNGDGRMDIAGLAFPGVAGVLLNTGSGAFGPLATYPVGGDPHTIAGGDINGDGRFDLVATINDIDIGLALLMGNGDGTFQAPVHLPNTAVADSPSAVVTNLDGDGLNDIAMPTTPPATSTPAGTRL